MHAFTYIFGMRFETEDLRALENCIKSILAKYAIRKNKEVYMIKLDKIIYAIKGCSRLILKIGCDECDGYTTINDVYNHFKDHHKGFLNKFILLSADKINNMNINPNGGSYDPLFTIVS